MPIFEFYQFLYKRNIHLTTKYWPSLFQSNLDAHLHDPSIFERQYLQDKGAIDGSTCKNQNQYQAIFDKRGSNVSIDLGRIYPKFINCRVWYNNKIYLHLN